jgi:sugar phosphate isomerase/epimerase
MSKSLPFLSRRQFNVGALALAGMSVLPAGTALAAATGEKNRFCLFLKFLNELSYDELAERVAALGFSGVEAPIRRQEGYIRPEEAAKELPKFVKALEKNGLKIAIVTSDILSADQQYAETLLRASADVGVPIYRMGFYTYDQSKSIVAQLGALREKFDALADLNRKVGITGVYQNHAGADYFGATIWDLYYLLKDHAPEEIGCVYDLRHAAVEAGESWPTLHAVIKPHIRAYSVKDFAWDGPKSNHMPLGEGLVDPAFYKTLAESDYEGPVSLHVEHLKVVDAEKQLAAVERDFAVLRKWMGE